MNTPAQGCAYNIIVPTWYYITTISSHVDLWSITNPGNLYTFVKVLYKNIRVRLYKLLLTNAPKEQSINKRWARCESGMILNTAILNHFLKALPPSSCVHVLSLSVKLNGEYFEFIMGNNTEQYVVLANIRKVYI